MALHVGIYPVIRKLGEGGMGKIFLVRDPSDGSCWAAKQFKGDLTRPLLVQRFRREFRALQALEHPAIVKVKNLEYTQKQMFFLMEYVNGKSMDQVLSDTLVRNSDWIKKVLRWMRYLCDPLHYIHCQNIVHRDLKPGNIMILDSDNGIPIKLLDFGVIHWTHADSIATGKLTFFGSLRYMAPEQINNETPDLRSDLYSMGVILYEALTGRPPFSIDNPLLLMNLHQMSDPPPPRRLNPNISENLQNLVLSMLFKRPDDRPGSALEVASWIDQILAGDEFGAPEIKAACPVTGMIFHPDFMGRDNEIKQLIRAWNLAGKGHTQICTIYGDAGIGKTRLLKRLFTMPDLASQLVCKGEFFADGALYSGFIQALKSGLAALYKRKNFNNLKPNSTDSIEAVETQFTSMIDNLEIKPDTTRQTGSLQAKAAGILQLLGHFAGNQPLILVLDDIHLAGHSDLMLLKNIIELHQANKEDVEKRGLFFVLGYRVEPDPVSEPLMQFLDWLDKSHYRSDHQLKGLSKHAVAKMIRSMLGGSSAASLIDSVYQDSSGNPLLVIETVKDIQNRQPALLWQDIDMDEDTLVISGDDRLIHLVIKRLDRLPDTAKRVLMASAVLGVIFRADELEQLCGMSDDVFLDQVDLLIRNRILEEDVYQRDSYRFTHAKIQESILENMSKPAVVKLHRKSISVLEQLHAGKLEPVALRLLQHSIECEWTEKIVDYHFLVAQNANQASDFEYALSHLEQAMALLPSLRTDVQDLDEKRIRIHLLMSGLLFSTGSIDRAEKILKTILTELESRDLPQILARTHLKLGAIYGSQGKINLALEHLNTSLAIYNRLNDIPMVIDCYINIGASYNSVADFENNRKYSALAMEKAQAIGDEERMAEAMINLGTSYVSTGRGNEGLPYLLKVIEISDATNSSFSKAYALLSIASHYQMDKTTEFNQERAEKVIELTEQVITIARKLAEPNLMADALYKRAVAKYFLGEQVIEDLDKSIEICKKIGQEWFARNVITFRNFVLMNKGDPIHE
jgi:eukaryotic-like serine/threonine-protein kinase